jgi:hypothetical protein
MRFPNVPINEEIGILTLSPGRKASEQRVGRSINSQTRPDRPLWPVIEGKTGDITHRSLGIVPLDHSVRHRDDGSGGFVIDYAVYNRAMESR